MKILFICGSLEPGKDGVGDYTRVLANELVAYGVSVYMVAIYDQYVKSILVEEMLTNINIVRVPRQYRWSAREKKLVKIIDLFNPDLISCQYVPFSYNEKGIPFHFAIYIGKLLSLKNVHIMVHEPYIMAQGKLSKYCLTRLQILSLRYFKLILKKATWFTSISWYQKLLKDIGINAESLPIFGNIRKVDFLASYEPLFERVENVRYLLFFASLPASKHWDLYFHKLSDYLDNSKDRLCLVFCGRVSNEGIKFKEFLSRQLPEDRVSLIDFGELASNQVSWLLQNCDCGVARVPVRLIGKSGAAVAMIEHGLPVWAPIVEKEMVSEINYENAVGIDLAVLIGNGRKQSRDYLSGTVHTMLRYVNY